MTQKRQTSTKQDIQEALIQLLLEEKFEHISVSKLCKRAGINRGTFYLHYEDKYDMMEKLKIELIHQLKIFEDHSDPKRELLNENFRRLRDKERLINAVTKSKYIDFREAIRDFICHIMLREDRKAATRQFLKDNFDMPEKYAQEVFLSSIEGILSLWIAGGAAEEPEEITEMILRTYDYSSW